jgi:hypothetical protein
MVLELAIDHGESTLTLDWQAQGNRNAALAADIGDLHVRP